MNGNAKTEIDRERRKRIRAEKTLMSMKLFLFDYFHKLGPNPRNNIDIIVETTCKALSSTVSLYNRLEDDALKTWSIYNEPENYKREDEPKGHICYDMTIRERSAENMAPVVLENLEGSKWEALDPNVKKYGLKSYMGFPVLLEGEVVGSLCVADVVRRNYSAIEKEILEAFAKAVTLEEERMLAQEKLTRSNAALKEKNNEIEKALSEVKTLTGLLPICASCKKIRDDKGYWNRLEAYIYEHTDAKLSHGFCPDCSKKLFPDAHGGNKKK
jgi:transcriptional regulator with GAF, ATPase, and Fis domain